MASPDACLTYLPVLAEKMRVEGFPQIAINTFSQYYKQVVSGETGLIRDAEIRPVQPPEINEAKTSPLLLHPGKRLFPR